MAITIDTSTPSVSPHQTGLTTPCTTPAFTPPASSLLLALCGAGWDPTGPLTGAVTDSGNHTWTKAVSISGTGQYTGYAGIFYTYLTTAPGSITMSFTVSGFVTGGGSFMTPLVLNGCAPNQSAGATASINRISNTDGTLSVTTTKPGSYVWGVGDDTSSNTTFTVNGATTLLVNDSAASTDSVTLVSWRSGSTGTPGAITLGGTWGSADDTNNVAFEVIPAVTAAPALAPRSLILPQALRRSYNW